MNHIPENLARLRHAHGFSLRDLAKIADCAHSTIWRLENERHITTRYTTLERLADALNVPVAAIVGPAGP